MNDTKGNDPPAKYKIQLFIVENEPNSLNAIKTINEICEKYLKGNYCIEIIDTIKNYQSAIEHKILVAPTLIVEINGAEFRIIGSLSDKTVLTNTLGIRLNGE